MTGEGQTALRWRAWGPEAFEEARARNAPILLDISAVWCHWCHVMDRTTYADPEVAAAIEEGFVPVRVDNDRRPDINRRYNMGGWPTTAFLTPGGEILTGGTYFPPETMGPLLRQVADAWRTRQGEFEARIAELAGQRRDPSVRTGPLTPAIVERILGGAINRYDRRFGGFGPAPKFPHPAALELLANRHLVTGEEQLTDMLFATLDGMSGGGMYDHVEGGFFRYSTTEDWSVPHFEKMGEDNAKLAWVALAAGTLPGGERFLRVAADVFRWVDASLADPDGGFFGSQDADEDYYALGQEDRAERDAPYVDRTLYAGWNGLMARAHLMGARLLGDPDLEQRALAALDRVLSLLGPPEAGLAHHWDGARSDVAGFLGDHADLGLAAVDAYQHTGDRIWLERARALAAYPLERLAAEDGGFFDRRPGEEGILRHPARPIEENAAFATLLLRLGRLLRDDRLLERARETLSSFAGGYDLYDLMGASFALAVDEALVDPVHVSVVGTGPEAAALRRAALTGHVPYRLVETIDPARDADLLETTGYPPSSDPAAYVCVGRTCHAPTSDPDEVPSLIRTAPR